MTDPPWAELPREVIDGVPSHLAEVAEAVLSALPLEVPSYARPLEGAFGQGIRQGVEVALARFLELPGTNDPALSVSARQVYVALGRGELRQGRELQTLLSAYRVGARVAFRQFAALVRARGVGADALVLLAESVFAYIDELSSASVEGYALEQSMRAGESDRQRTELLALLVSGRPDGPAAAEASRLAGWALPDRVVAAVLDPARAEGLAGELGRTALVGPVGEHVVVLLPAAESARLARRLVGRRAALGPARPWRELGASIRLAVLGLDLLAAGRLHGDPVPVQEHLLALVVHRDPDLVRALAADRLAPLADLKPATRDRLAETLLAWLRHRGERQHVAAELHVHPQTVGYRLGQLRELFGPALDDPDGRFALELALRAER